MSLSRVVYFLCFSFMLLRCGVTSGQELESRACGLLKCPIPQEDVKSEYLRSLMGDAELVDWVRSGDQQFLRGVAPEVPADLTRIIRQSLNEFDFVLKIAEQALSDAQAIDGITERLQDDEVRIPEDLKSTVWIDWGGLFRQILHGALLAIEENNMDEFVRLIRLGYSPGQSHVAVVTSA